jgi:hypothetical protein
MSTQKWLIIAPILMASIALIPSTVFAQQADTAASTTNATSDMSSSNATDIVNKLAQATGQPPEAFAAAQAIQLQNGTFVASFVCPPDMQEFPADCKLFIGVPPQN